MDHDEFAELQRLFEEAIALPVHQRRSFVEHACAGRPERRARLERLLKWGQDEAADLPGLSDAVSQAWDHADVAALEQALADWSGGPSPESSEEPIIVGRYRLLRTLGHGGMGAVYEAVREGTDFTQRVAVKLVRPGWGGPEIIRRFLAERKILAQLEHPAIARFVDGGVTEEGRPYFAMEYVEGVPIDRYCDERRLDVRERIDLFLDACGAVQHAHERFVVHRDLKPSNILVTPEGAVKLLDFGIATVWADDATRGNTLFGTGAGTPFYMSPEQFRADAITAASDVYSLGVLLFELLTGTAPYRPQSRHPRDVEKAVLDQDAERPSTAVGWPNPRTSVEGTADGVDEVCARRRTVPGRLRRALRGELDAILMKCLEKDPTRRYASVQALVDDLQRYLSGHPVRARPASTVYRLSRAVRRHPLGVSSAATIVLLLAAYAVTLSVQNARVEAALERAEREAAKSGAVSTFLLGLFRASSPAEHLGEPLTAAELLERGVAQAEEMADASVRAELYHVLGRTYRSNGRFSEALPLMERAVQLRRGPPPAADADLGASLDDLASILQDLGRMEEAEVLFLEALDVRARLGEDHPDHIESLNNLGVLYIGTGDLVAAERLVRRTLEARRRIYEPGNPRIGVAMNNLASVLDGLGKFEEVEQLQREVLELWRENLGPEHPDVALAMSNLAVTLARRGVREEAEVLHREALELRQKVFPANHPYIGISMNNLASVLERPGTIPAEVLALRRGATRILEEALGPDHLFTLRSTGWLGAVLMQVGQVGEGERLLLRAIEETASEPAEQAQLQLDYGLALLVGGREGEATPILRGALGVLDAAAAVDPDMAVARARLDSIGGATGS